MNFFTEKAQIDKLVSELNEAAAKGVPLAEQSAATIMDLLARVRPQEVVSVNLFTNIATRGLLTVRLSPSEASLLYRLEQAYPSAATVKELYKAVYGKTLRRSDVTLRNLIRGLRQRVQPLHINIRNNFGSYTIELLPIPNI